MPGRIVPAIALTFAVVLLNAASGSAQCRWDGTAPFCGGECGDNEVEATRLGAVPDFWTAPYVVQTPPFGASCLTGTKALCCSDPRRRCRWRGTAPFCAGACGSDEIKSQPPDHSSGGAACWTGSKVYCCQGTVAAIRQGLSVGRITTGAGKCLDVHAPDQQMNGGKVQVWDCNNSLQQSWMVFTDTIRSHAGKCLDVHAADQHSNGGKVQVWDCNGSPQQKWTIQGSAIRSAAGKCLDVHAADQHLNGGKVQVWDCNGSVQQTWLPR